MTNDRTQPGTQRPQFPITGIPAQERGLLSVDYIQASSNAHARAKNAWLKSIPNLDGHVTLTLDDRYQNMWIVALGKKNLSGRMLSAGGVTATTFYFDPSEKFINVSYSKKGRTKGDQVDGHNKPWILQLANQDLTELVRPAEEAAKSPKAPPQELDQEQDIEEQVANAPTRAKKALLKDIPNFKGATFDLTDRLGNRWTLAVSNSRLSGTKLTPGGAIAEEFRIQIQDEKWSPHVFYSTARRGKTPNHEGDTPAAKKMALEKLSELLAPAEKAGI